MNTRRKFGFASLILVMMLMLVLSACGNSQTASNESAGTEPAVTEETAAPDAAAEEPAEEEAPAEDAAAQDDTQYPVTIKSALGDAVIEKKPERVVTIQWGNQDVALALGVVPVGFSAANFGVKDEDKGLLPWTKEKLDELGATDPNVFQDTDGLDFEAISDAKPDVILAAYSGITQEDYDTLSEIAPVVAYPTSPWTTKWREQIQLSAEGMGLKVEGDQLIADTEKLVSDKFAAYPQLKDKKIAWVNFSADDLSKLHIYTPVDTRVSFLEEMGLTYPESITSKITDPDSYSLELSAENAEALNDVDIIVGYGDDKLYEALKADPLLGKIPAIERGSVAFIAADTPLVAAGTPTPLSIAYTIDDYMKLLGAAADKVK
ncbi:iron-siderophore ABC transporter substrate-binding protein [Saccharibacillus sp. CPCC 101409]|uniref:iron-siderophore ABC transporter substrate-binding protein n=1 Tax=Saccharibacillus sp. CPCC 101409 TaxID=3058041 RepID=UPI002671B741|nr:iron-siderophore ABC transporter substrate-binding protein [Saccharibacillus sp. CPCC 101409]MDO3409786.1 iron-siderophore ABC transporter substrate-binding protein [Saccharibacillus sp. CPCC 101409]